MRGVVATAVVVSALAGGAAAAAVGGQGRESAAAGAVRATLTYRTQAGFPAYSKLHLTVVDGSRRLIDAPITSTEQNGAQFVPGGFGSHKTLLFRDLDGDGVDELVVSLFTDGAHCCYIDQIFDFSAARPKKVEKEFGDPGAVVESLDGHVVLRSADDAFAYAFTDYADSALPIVIWRYTQSGRFENITRSFPAAVSRDAAVWWSAQRSAAKSRRDSRGVLAAWAADEALLGHAAAARATLLRLAAVGSLDKGFGGPKGAAYVRALWRFLARHHYVH